MHYKQSKYFVVVLNICIYIQNTLSVSWEWNIVHQGINTRPHRRVRTFIRLSPCKFYTRATAESARPCTHFIISTSYISIPPAIMKNRSRVHERYVHEWSLSARQFQKDRFASKRTTTIDPSRWYRTLRVGYIRGERYTFIKRAKNWIKLGRIWCERIIFALFVY